MKYPFEVPYSEIEQAPDAFVSVIFSSLASEFLALPKGEGFVEYSAFEAGYEALKKITGAFRVLPRSEVVRTVLDVPISFVVLRSILGFTPPEWAYVTSQRYGLELNQGFARTLDRKVRLSPVTPLRPSPQTLKRIEAMVGAACDLLEQGCPAVAADQIHRLQKADTAGGLVGLGNLADIGVPYAMLLYERFLGRPFAGHRDSVSELVGDGLENAIEEQLTVAGISFTKTRRAERLPGFDQAPDFVIPSQFNPAVVIEAKLTEDDGTARDKVTRIQHLHSLSSAGQSAGQRKFEVVACIAGRGFGVRREDMRKLLIATRGKVFTPKTLDQMVDCTDLKKFRTR